MCIAIGVELLCVVALVAVLPCNFVHVDSLVGGFCREPVLRTLHRGSAMGLTSWWSCMWWVVRRISGRRFLLRAGAE